MLSTTGTICLSHDTTHTHTHCRCCQQQGLFVCLMTQYTKPVHHFPLHLHTSYPPSLSPSTSPPPPHPMLHHAHTWAVRFSGLVVVPMKAAGTGRDGEGGAVINQSWRLILFCQACPVPVRLTLGHSLPRSPSPSHAGV